MDATTMTPADYAAVTRNGNGWGDNSVLWFVLLLFMMGGMGAWGGRGAAPMPGNYVTQNELTNGLNNVQTQAQLNQIGLSSANNNYETAQLINGQTNALLQQRYTDQINMVQGFNQVNTNMMAQTNTLGSKLDNLASKMDQCCCSIKTQMLQDKYEAVQNQLNNANNIISNQAQTQQLLSQFGRFVPWAGNGNVGTTATAA